jgi:hypothetical protein
MKKIFTYALALVVLFASETVFGQSYTFRVLANKGTNKFKRAGQVSDLKTGSTLNVGDELIASEGAYIGLMHKSGKTLEVKKPGTYTISELEKQVTVGATGTAQRLAGFVNEKMNEEQSGNYRTKMNATGAISRAVTAEGKIPLLLADESVEFVSENAIIRWQEKDKKANVKYVVTIRNIYDDVIFSTETTESFVNINFNDERLKNDATLYLFTVAEKDNPEMVSLQIAMKRKKGSDYQQIMTEYNALRNELTEDTPLNKLIFASFFEEKGLLLDALTKYEEAVRLAPDVADFKELYENFLLINGLK